jgi:uracil-DNA glycosylase
MPLQPELPLSTERRADKPDTCLGCPLYLHGEGFVVGEGDINSKIMIVGEAPGKDEAIIGRPFVGGSGRVLTKLMILAGINRWDTYVTNVVKCRPWTNNENKDNRPPTPEEVSFCSQYLIKELRASTANIIVLAGKTALESLTDKKGIGKFRGTPFMSGGRKVIGVAHPADVMRNQEMWPITIHDLRKARHESLVPDVYILPTNYVTDARLETDGVALLRSAHEHGYVVFDLESAGGDPKKPNKGALSAHTSNMVCMGLGVEERTAFCFRWPGDRNPLLVALFEDPSIIKVGQNSSNFDEPYCEDKGYVFKGPSFDTHQAAHLIYSDGPKSLDHLGSMYGDFPNWKDDKKDIFLYNCRDIDVTGRAFIAQRRELRSLGLEDLMYRSVMPLQPRLRAMSRKGIKKDVDKAELWSMRIRSLCDQRENNLRQGLSMPFLNVNSSQQLKDLFYNKMGLPVQWTKDAKTKEMRPTCNKEALARLAEIVPASNKIFHEIIDIRHARTSCSTFIDVEHDENDFVHPHFGTSKAANGRVHSEDPNGQNIPVQLREIYIPDSPDHIFLELDWSQVEWRLQVVLTGDRRGLDLLSSGLDNHRAVAAEILGKPYSSITDDERHAAKFVVHGLGYGRSAKSIAKQYGIPQSTVQMFIDRFFARFSDFKVERDNWVDTVGKTACLINPFTRRRWWFSRTVTEIFNFLASSTAADMMYTVINDGHDHTPANWSMRLTVHDSLLLCGPKENLKEAWEFGKDLMQRRWPQITEHSKRPELVKKMYGGDWWCVADGAIGETWKQCKPKTKDDKIWQKENLAFYGIKEAA